MKENKKISLKTAISLSGLLVLLLVLGSSTAMAQVGDIQASFTSNTVNGYAPLMVQFNDTSTGSPTGWSWDFGDGNTSTDQNPMHTYSTAGVYTVTLTVTNAAGTDTDEESDYITVNPGPDPSKPVANFSATPTLGNAPLKVKFTDSSTGNVNSWNWNFGDGVHSYSKNPTHTYKAYGSYDITLTVKNAKGFSNTTTKLQYINVSELPVADFTMNTSSGYAPLTVKFTDKSAYAASWNWNFGDGNTSTDKNPSYTYSKAGTYTVNLTVTSATKQISSKLATVTVIPILPGADFTSNLTKGFAPLSVQFTDNSLHATSWLWNFGDGSTSTKQNPTHTYLKAGDYTVTLTASNADGSDADEEPNYIHVDAPLVADFSASPTSGNAPLKVTFTDNSTGNPNGWYWNFGDGTHSKSKNAVHTYTKTGNYNVTLTVNYADGNKASSKVVTINVTQLPVANFSMNTTSGYAPLTVQFTDKSVNATGWSWNFGDGATSTDQNPAHTYSKIGKYTVNLTVSNANGATSKVAKISVLQQPLPVSDFTSNVTSGNAPLSVQFTDNSANSPTSWLWDFGDGATSTDKNPVHIYSAGGKYTVALTVSNAAGTDTDEEADYISVKDIPKLVADFSASPISGNVPLKVTFTDKSTGTPTKWNWTFGDGTRSKSKNITHTYSKVGNYTVSLTVTNANGDTASNSTIVTVSPKAKK